MNAESSEQNQKPREEITMPNREEMLKRLLDANKEESLQKKFYPILLQEAGQEKFPEGIVMLLAEAIFQYTEGMPAAVHRAMYLSAPRFIESLVHDKEKADKTKELWNEMISSQAN